MKAIAYCNAFNEVEGVEAGLHDYFDVLIKDIPHGKWDWAFVMGQGLCTPEELGQLRGKAGKLAIWDADALNLVRKKLWLARRRSADIVFSSSLANTKALANLGVNAYFIPQAYIPEEAEPLLDRLERHYFDVTFIGRIGESKKRLTWIRKLQNRHHVGFFGTDSYITGELLGTILASSAIVIDIKREEYDYGLFTVSNRIFQTMGSGAFFLTYEFPGCDMYFKVGEHLAFYNDTLLGLCEQCMHWLHNPEERERIALQGQEEILENHTLSNRAQDYVRLMESI